MNMLRKSVLNEQVIAEERKLVNRKEMDWYWPKFAASLADAFIEYLEDNESEHGQTLKINQIAPVVTESTGYYQVEEDIPEAPRKTIPGDWHYIPMDVRAALESSRNRCFSFFFQIVEVCLKDSVEDFTKTIFGEYFLPLQFRQEIW